MPVFNRVIASVIASFVAFLMLLGTAYAEELNIYSARHYDTDLDIYDRFTEETGIKVNLIEGQSEELLARLAQEGEFSPGDVLLTVDAGRLWRAEQAGLFASVSSDFLNSRIPAHLRHPDGLWFGISKRARIIIYNKSLGKPEALTTYADLANPEYKGKICVRSSNSIYNISLLASIIAHDGPEAAEAWAKGVVANFARTPQGNDTAQIRAVAAGECSLGIVNTYYFARLMGSDDPADRAVAANVGVIFPNQNDRGTHVNISGAGVLVHAPHRKNAIKFLEFLASDWTQNELAAGNNEYPTVPTVETQGPVTALGTFKEDELNASALGHNQSLAIRIFDRAGWR